MAGMGATAPLSSIAHVVAPQAMSGLCVQHLCLQHPCVQRPMLSASDAATAVDWSPLQPAFLIAPVQWPAAESLPNWLSDPPPLRNSSLVSLHTVLRV